MSGPIESRPERAKRSEPQRDGACGCTDGACPPSPTLPRREFLAGMSWTALGALAARRSVFAGPFEEGSGYRDAIPADKRLDPAWVESLYARGVKTIYNEPAALRRIGMPVGGLFAGTVYLGGDGRLWLWDIFNRDQEGILPRPLQKGPPGRREGEPLVGNMVRAGLNFLEPAAPSSPFRQGFTLRVRTAGHDEGRERSLDLEGFSDITFDGRYPLGLVTYRSDEMPVEARLEAFSPFVPLDADSSSLPVVAMRYSLVNRSDSAVSATILGHLENPVCLHSRDRVEGQRMNRVARGDRVVGLVATARPLRARSDRPTRPDIVFEDFEKDGYAGWTVEGDAFGEAPARVAEIPSYQGDVAGHGERVVNSHATAPGDDIAAKDGRVGLLTSEEFEIRRRFIRMRVGGGANREQTCVELLIGDEVVARLTGRNENRMRVDAMDVRRFEGQRARLRIADRARGGWGNIGVDEIVFTDERPTRDELEAQSDFGSMALVALPPAGGKVSATARRGEGDAVAAEAELHESLEGEVSAAVELAPGEERAVTFLVAWHFPNLRVRAFASEVVGNRYAERFGSALEVAEHVAERFDELHGATRRWVDTWYDSSLPHWLLDRTMANTSILATTTCYRFRDGRFWAWEGIGCCPGTCTHVWHYAQAPGRLFPEIERDQRERVDFGMALHADGGVGHRAYLGNAAHPAVDGHCGRVLGAYREHLMSADDAFLRRIWPRVRRAVDWLIAFDGNDDGVLEGAQHNTLDAAWYGKISWLTSLHLAALRAGAAMAREMEDEPFARRCEAIAERGAHGILEMWNGEYFVQLEDPAHADAIGTGAGCHIDQVFGQTWAHWVGLGALFDRERQLSALRALWRYNFAPDVGVFRERFPRGRWYAAAGDAGLVMCTWPKGGESAGYARHWQYGYFNECMTGFEWQAAAHMVYEGIDQPDLLESGLAVARAIHDRYDASLRNPYNEIECSDHYSRAMASYGVFQAVCGFECNGPRGHLAFAPRIAPERFRAAFVAPEGWGSFSQTIDGEVLSARIEVRHGHVDLATLGLRLPRRGVRVRAVEAVGRDVEGFRDDGDRVIVSLVPGPRLEVGDAVEVRIETTS